MIGGAPEMTTQEVLADLRDRLARAYTEIERLADQALVDGMHTERARLKGKAEGIALAQDYLRSYP